MVAVDSRVIIDIRSKKQEERIQKALAPSKRDIGSVEFNETASDIAKRFIEARKGIERLTSKLQ
ncbi:hypothetical protein KII95_08800 [Leuconostoc gelidum subsp. aenigmaticum]|uniref:hypothetical protein n=1 Tax=Leuconostoc gelidum group TaxID=3016637 RepID=UPI001CC4DEE7|nr:MULTISPECIES: hypothetical protein [Leuconostoc gelidum group]MBZ5958129.1 hypothetical protein [Leuconostoc gasicomitatum]MBZ6004106.1 hypothetical protein [Leuconostoc gelidum subsp. aenigmaticum]